MIERHDMAHRPDAKPLGAGAGADRIKARRRHPAFVGPEMMLDAERIIEAEFVASLQFAPQLFVTPMRRHSGLGPDMGEMREFHGITYPDKRRGRCGYAVIPRRAQVIATTFFCFSTVSTQKEPSPSSRLHPGCPLPMF